MLPILLPFFIFGLTQGMVKIINKYVMFVKSRPKITSNNMFRYLVQKTKFWITFQITEYTVICKKFFGEQNVTLKLTTCFILMNGKFN